MIMSAHFYVPPVTFFCHQQVSTPLVILYLSVVAYTNYLIVKHELGDMISPDP